MCPRGADRSRTEVSERVNSHLVQHSPFEGLMLHKVRERLTNQPLGAIPGVGSLSAGKWESSIRRVDGTGWIRGDSSPVVRPSGQTVFQ